MWGHSLNVKQGACMGSSMTGTQPHVNPARRLPILCLCCIFGIVVAVPRHAIEFCVGFINVPSPSTHCFLYLLALPMFRSDSFADFGWVADA